MILTRCKMACGRSQVICNTLRFDKPGPILQVFDMFVSSIYRYSLGTWGVLAGNLHQIDNLFCNFIRRHYKLPATTCRRSILMQFGRRCAVCDARYLAAVQLARGLSDPDSTWGNVLRTVWASQRPWLREVLGHLQRVGLKDDVIARPAAFLGERKEHGRTFSEWCHFNHLTTTNGRSSDFFRVDRPYGIYPALFDVRSCQSRVLLVFVLSCWRWAFNLRHIPSYCSECDCVVCSEHLLFRCVRTQTARDNFLRRTGKEFEMQRFRESTVSYQIVNLCEEIISILQRW
jgi:hypothetical protein